MKNKLFVMLVFSLVFISFVSASDVAYLYNKEFAVDQNIVDVFEEMGLSVDFVQDKEIKTTNFDNYKMIFINDERFRYGLDYIPVATKPGIVANYYYGLEFGLTDYDGVSKLAMNSPLSVNVNETIKQVYTQSLYKLGGIAIPYYFLDDENKRPEFITAARTYTGANDNNGDYNFGDVISYINVGTELNNGKETQGKLCFFGIVESDYWTPAARQMFKDCVGFAAMECSSSADCPSSSETNDFCLNNDSHKNVTTYSCQNPGTALSKCVANVQEKLIEDCGQDSCDVFGGNYCKSGNVYNNRTCYDRGCLLGGCSENLNLEEKLVDTCTADEICLQGTCIEKPIVCSANSDCGTNSWLGQEVCQNGDSYDLYLTFSCTNSRTTDSYCSNSTQLLKKEDCAVGCVDGSCVDCLEDSNCDNDFSGDLFCKDNNVWNDFTDNSCVNYKCVSKTEDKLNETCAQDEICSNGECLEIACSQHSDCGTNGFSGVDYCSVGNSFQNFVSFTCNNAGTVLSYCSNVTLPILQDYCEGDCVSGECVDCFNNLSCGTSSLVGEKYCDGTIGGDVFQNYKEFSCINPGTGQSSCLSSVFPKLIEDCTMGQACVSGECVDISCFSNADCNDSTSSTYDECVSPGSVNSYCRNTPINCASDSDCGFTGFSGSEFCLSDNVFKNYQSAICYNAGTTNSFCSINLTQNLIASCGQDSCNAFGGNYCEGGDVYRNRTCNDRGCLAGACNSSSFTESVLVENCENGCSQGVCLPDVLCGEFDLTVSNLRKDYGVKPSCPETYWYYYDLEAREVTGDAPIKLSSRQRSWLNGDSESLKTDIVAKFGTDVIPAGGTINAFNRWFCTDFSPDEITEIIVGASENCTDVTKQYSIYVTP